MKNIKKLKNYEPQKIKIGKKTAVVLDLEVYEKMIESLEDAYLGKKSEAILKKGKFVDFVQANKKLTKK
jgi:hypothetical protein